MVEIGVDKNSMIVFPAPLMSTIGELGAFLSRETKAADSNPRPTPDLPAPGIAETEKAAATPRANGVRAGLRPWAAEERPSKRASVGG